MTALPSNLALVGEDLARATFRDARRSVKRRRLVTYSIALALLALTATAAVAHGWLFAETPTVKAVPALGAPDGGRGRILLSGLGSEQRVLSSVTTASGGVCLTLTGFEQQCVPTFLAGQHLSWYSRSIDGTAALIFGIVRDDVTAIDAVSASGRTTRARLANDAFYLELPDGLPDHLVAHLSDGTTSSVAVTACPVTDPDCAP